MPTKGYMEVDPNHCKGCGLCIEACPEDCIEFSSEINRLGYHPARYKGEGCIGCGFCFYTCPEPNAITVYKKGKEVA
ncbi:ferredoxin family protein [bacterium]|nr:ferredoxin family protein [bacterium]